MNPNNIERLIRNLGCSYDALVDNKVIDNHPLQNLYEDGESLEVVPAPGVELIFWPDTLRFEAIHITLRDDQGHGVTLFGGDLPDLYDNMVDQTTVHQRLGKPIFGKGLLELQGTGLGGWDTYQINSELHPAALIEFQYSNSLKVNKIMFSLIDRNI